VAQFFAKSGGVIVVLLLLSGVASAQDMEPRAYSNAPVGLNFLVVSYGYSTGNVVVDSALPLEDFNVHLNASAIAYVRTTDFFGSSGKVALVVPYAWGHASGRVLGELMRLSRSGVSDPRIKVSMIFKGAPALKPQDFVRYRQRTLIGASFQMSVPLGQYDPAKLVNLGTNRWAFRPEIGLSRASGKLTLELYGSVTFFTENHKYLQTSTRSQSPIGALQGHAAYTIRPGLWAAFDAIYYAGGRTSVNGVRQNDLQSNARYGFTCSVPLARQQSLKFLYTSGLITRIGSHFKSAGVAYQFAW
jgi:Putative MetA-pathway of phenol degradation